MRNNITREDLDEVIKLLQTEDPKLTSGPKVLEFEKKWSEWLGVKYSIFVNSGSSSNLLAIAWLKNKFPNGGKIIVPPFTWSSDISSVLWMGFDPEFVDINMKTLAIDEDKFEEKISRNNDIRAIFLTHAQGINGLTEKIYSLCKKHNIFLIEDVCESHGVNSIFNKKAGSIGDISCFSYYYAHHMSTIEGGMVCTNDKNIYEFLIMSRAHGMLRESKDREIQAEYKKNYQDLNPLFIFPMKGFNFRNNEIGATIGLNQLKRLDEMIEIRKKNFSYFLNGLPNWAFKDFDLKGQSNYAFNLILKDKDNKLMSNLQETLNNNGIEFRKGSAGGGNQIRQPYVRSLGKYLDEEIPIIFPISDHIHFYSMYIGNYPSLTFKEIDLLLEKINGIK